MCIMVSRTRDEFIKDHMSTVELTVRYYISRMSESLPTQKQHGINRRLRRFLFDEMYAEGLLNLVALADRRANGDKDPEFLNDYTNYVVRASWTKCVDVLRRQYGQNKKIQGILDNYPFDKAGLCVLDVDDLYHVSFGASLIERIRNKETIDWREYLPEDEANLVVQYLNTYPTTDRPPDKATRARLRQRVYRIVRKILK